MTFPRIDHKSRDMTGKRCGLVTVIRRCATNVNGQATWVCKCDCGAEKLVAGTTLRSKPPTTHKSCKRVPDGANVSDNVWANVREQE